MALFLLALCIAGESSAVDDWPGWRGVDAQGAVDEGALAEDWSPERATWDVEVDGSGYSSPIVVDDMVLLTTSYETVRGQLLASSSAYLTLVLCLMGVVLANRYLVRRCREPTSWGDGFGLISFDLIWIAILAFVLFGENALNYSSTRDVRSWVASGGGVVLCLVALGFFPSGKWLRYRVGSALMIAFGVIYLLSIPMPTRQYLLDGTLLSDPTGADTLVVAFVPIVLVVLSLLFGVSWTITDWLREPVGAATHNHSEPGWPAVRRVFLLRGASLGALGLSLGVLWIVVRSSDYLAHHVGDRIQQEPALGWPATLIALLVYLVSPFSHLMARDRGGEGLSDSYRLVVVALAAQLFLTINFISSSTQLSRAVLALDATTGREVWRTEGLEGPLGVMNSFNTAATPTPVSDGERVYAYFGSAGILATDLTGRMVWQSEAYRYENVYGTAVSPVVADGVLILVVDTPEDPYVVGIGSSSGEELWRTARDPKGFSFNGVSRTPLVRSVDDGQVVLVWGDREVSLYDLHTGVLRGRTNAGRLGGGDRVVSPIADGERIFFLNKTRAAAFEISELARADDASPIWVSGRIPGPNCATPVEIHGLIFSVSDWGVASCLDAATGELLWRQQLAGEFYSSPIAAGESVFFTNTAGETTVVRAAREFEEIASSRLPGAVFASPAALRNTVFVRSDARLYRFDR